MERTTYSDKHLKNMFETLTHKLIQASEAFQLHDALFTEIKEEIETLNKKIDKLEEESDGISNV